MITKQQYQNLKLICSSSNIDDVLMVGPVILSLRNSKQLKRRQVSDLFKVLLKNGNIVTGSMSKTVDHNWNYIKLTDIRTVKGIFVPLTLKWKWLNGTL